MLQLHVSDESEPEADSDLDVNICDLEPESETLKKRKNDPVVSEGFVPVTIDNRKFAEYVPATQAGNVRKRKVITPSLDLPVVPVSDVLPVPPTPVGEQYPRLPVGSMPVTESMFLCGLDVSVKQAATNRAYEARTTGPRKVIRKPKPAVKSRTSPRKPSTVAAVKTEKRKYVRKAKLPAVKGLGPAPLVNSLGQIPSAAPCVQTPPEQPRVDKDDTRRNTQRHRKPCTVHETLARGTPFKRSKGSDRQTV
eukprot:jgi/Botrbrau1/7825/Bobra.9_2s0006.1